MILTDYVEINPRVAITRGIQVPFVSMNVVEPGTRNVYPIEERPARGSGSKFCPGDTLFARITPCLENGKIAQYAGECPGMGSTEFFVLRARKGVSDPSYVYYFSQRHDLRSDAVKSMSGASGRQRAVISALSDFECEFPPLEMQQRIAGILSAYDELIENSQRRIKILESMARALYREWFVHFRYPGHEFVSLVPSSLGDIPQGWEVKNLGSLADIKWGDTSTTKESYVEKGYAAYSASGLDGQLDHYDFDRMGIVLSAIGAQCGKTWLASGKWSCIKNTIRFWAKNECVSTEFLFIATQGQDFWPRRGAAQPFISQGDAERIDVLIPDRATMERFTTFVADSLKHIATFTIQIQNLRRTRDLLLPRLLSGQINVEALAA